MFSMRSLALRLPARRRIAEHEHAWAQVVFAARGVVTVNAHQRRWTVPPTRCLWIPAGTRHEIETISETWLRTLYVHPESSTLMPSQLRVLDVSPLLRELLLESVRLGMLSPAVHDHRALTQLIMSRLHSARALDAGLPMPTDVRARRVVERVLRDPGARDSLTELAVHANASVRTLERLFVAQTGLTLGRWRQEARLQHAVRLLADNTPVTTTAVACGYDSPSAFVTMFRRALGTTPRRYLRAADA